jgi:hypothetical protein
MNFVDFRHISPMALRVAMPALSVFIRVIRGVFY